MSHSPPISAGNQSPYPVQEPPHVKQEVLEKPLSLGKDLSRWSFLPILTATISVAAAIGAVAILLLPESTAQKS